jgi:ATP-dependent DNA helicase RecQ
METAEAVLSRVWGYPAFRGRQGEVVARLMAGHDVAAVMPTGAGKSICYQVPAIARPGTGLVISPLIALMRDQVRSLGANGVAAAALTSEDADANAQAMERFVAGALDLLYVAPERATAPVFQRALSGRRLSLVAIDEAHCVSQWGHDFRPDYRQLRPLLDQLRGVPRAALTATADARTRDDILAQLGIAPDALVLAGFDRPNIRYEVRTRTGGQRQLIDFIRPRRGQSGIVYVPSRAGTEKVAAYLEQAGIRALPYHAGFSAAERNRHQHAFTHCEGVVMVATIAFGMGIDKPDVRFVAHLGLPGSVEAYYQETGRAGRDGDPAVAHLLWAAGDAALARQRIEEREAPPERKAAERARIDALVAYAEAASCRRAILLRYFGETPPARCGACDNCLAPPSLRDVTTEARKFLSAVYKTGQRFGAGYIARVLRGEPDERAEKLGHDKLSVWGIGRDRPAAEWTAVARRLTALGALEADPDYKGLTLGAAARPILKGEVPVALRADSARPPRRERGASPGAVADSPELSADALARFDALREWRREAAAAQGVPPYVVFHDSVLRAVALLQPTTLDGLAAIPGVGSRKLEAYGKAVLAVIAGDRH